MAFRVDLQSAPSRRGTIGDPSAWSGSGPTVTASGGYVGDLSKTYTFTSLAAATPGSSPSVPITWDDGEGNTGRMNLGTDHDYVAGGPAHVHENLSIAMAGTAIGAGTQTFTIAVTAGNRLPGSPIVVTGDANPVDIRIPSYAKGDIDMVASSFDGRERRFKRSTTGQVSIRTDWLDDTNRDKLLYLHSERADVCIGENYDEDTVFLMHGGGLQPFVGTRTSFTAAGVRTYQDPRTGLLRSVAAGLPRVVGGKAGRAFTLEDTTTNLFTQSSGKVGTLFWFTSGSGVTLSYDTTILGPFEPSDEHWDSDFTDGVVKMASTAAVTPGTDSYQSTDATVSQVQKYAASIWLRGRGSVVFRLRAGAGSPANVLTDSATIQLTSTWTRYSIVGVTGVGYDTADIAIMPQEAGVCYAWGWQLEAGFGATSLIQTNGGTVARAAESVTFERPIPVAGGTFSFWLFWPGPISDGTLATLIEATGVSGSEQFRLNYTHQTTAILHFTTSTAANLFALPTQFPDNEWRHIVLTWAESATASSLDMKVYVDGAEVGSGATVSTWEPFFGTGFEMVSNIGGTSIEEPRIDKRAWTATEVATQYDRLTSDDWLHVHRAHAGRKYRITSLRESWLSVAVPGKIIMDLTLTEVDREDDSVVVES